MDRLLYLAMTGASQTMHALASTNNNLANADTVGFRQDLAAARAMPVVGPGLPSRVYAMTERPGVDLTPGSVQHTGRELDVTIDGDGWLAVQAADGGEAYTRAGDLRVDAFGVLTTGAGLPVFGEGGPVAIPPADKIEIGADGTVSIRPLGEEAGALVPIDRLRLVNPDPAGLIKGDDGLMRLRGGESAAPDAFVRLRSGALEGSNVDAVAALTSMIELARRYEMNVKAMKAADENASVANQLLRLG